MVAKFFTLTFLTRILDLIQVFIVSFLVLPLDKPSIQEIKVTSLESKSVNLTWEIRGSQRYPVKKQELVYFLEKTKMSEKRIKLEGKKRSCKIRELTPYANYVIRLKAWNDYISSDWQEITFTTATDRKFKLYNCSYAVKILNGWPKQSPTLKNTV